jgi:hypothetical protein
VCSNSSAGDQPALRLLTSALAVLAREAPAHHMRLAERLADLAIRCTIGHEVLSLSAVDGVVVIAAGAAGADGGPTTGGAVIIRSELATILALLDGGCTLLDAVRARRLDVRGAATALVTAADTCSVFLHGLVRCPAASELLTALRATCDNPLEP